MLTYVQKCQLFDMGYIAPIPRSKPIARCNTSTLAQAAMKFTYLHQLGEIEHTYTRFDYPLIIPKHSYCVKYSKRPGQYLFTWNRYTLLFDVRWITIKESIHNGTATVV